MEHANISTDLKILLGFVILLYVAGMFALSVFAQRNISTAEDYVVAGRRLPLSLAWATLLATWFGAGTMLAASSEVARRGYQGAALDPLGAGLCLILAGLFFARPLWEMGLLTISDFFRRKFGERAEILSACILIPGYFGWIAAQFVALAHMLNLFFDLPVPVGIFLVALVGAGYTLIGGMWSVTLTDAAQIAMVLGGLAILMISVLCGLGDGNAWLGYLNVIQDVHKSAPEKLVWIPTSSQAHFWAWTSLLAAGALGNIPGQDLLQRIFASRSAKVAQQACLFAGVAYLIFGFMPVLLGLVAYTRFGSSVTDSVLPALAHAFMHPALAVVFVVVLMSAVLSTIDSAILAPSTVLAQNLLSKMKPLAGVPSLLLNRCCVLAVAACSLAVAYSGERAWSLLEGSYSMLMVGLFVPLACGLYSRPRGELPGTASMVAGVSIWLPQFLAGWDCFGQGIPSIAVWQLPLALTSTVCSLLTYLAVFAWQGRSRESCSAEVTEYESAKKAVEESSLNSGK